MILLPAIDILEGKAVRLTRGEFDQKTVYDSDPLDAARRWIDAGARELHIVDLDGARSGAPVNLDHIRRIGAAIDVRFQVGGGLRTIEAVREAIEAGATWVVIGTAAYSDIDARAGKLAGAGWTEQTDIPLEAVIERLGARGVQRFVYSSIDRDGMLQGPDLAGARRVAEAVRGIYAYSGGVSSLEDLRALVDLRQVNMRAVIVGKALYEGRFTVADAQALLDE
jgi:phosphoribosylformimino-5-aminoimidazole carboxamide ribonucleotide (ProFAR) isomerase